MMMVVIFAMVFVLLALGLVITLMVRSHGREFHGRQLRAGSETHGVK
ncbi:MFS-type transporter involved in bile tolerance (Atg22 family) [Edaphobacter lichenicola]|uniref:MFS-type transporter involved in bile tolerance (Atg22 family) n=1 Tax=Tunturiibacter empetritectus TaxID=3069691 RepID=A0A7W8MPN4_9BACT|nr:MFS-type transporter involved in bile tolerance (Atg22 family) [Edaphobacter lichenicola]